MVLSLCLMAKSGMGGGCPEVVWEVFAVAAPWAPLRLLRRDSDVALESTECGRASGV
jgi:hypothetical protein